MLFSRQQALADTKYSTPLLCRRVKDYRAENRLAGTLALVYGIRMLGLFMVLPVLPLYAGHLEGATPFTIGLALGIYGLSQALLQRPFGQWSDRLGRRPLIIAGLLLFAGGSLLAAAADTIIGVILGRLLQGTGAVAGVLMACVGDWVAGPRQLRTMAFIGGSIGLAFALALTLGPWLNATAGLTGVFMASACLACIAIIPVLFWLPAGRPPVAPTPAPAALRTSPQVWYAGAFVLHMVLTAVFVIVPVILTRDMQVAPELHWRIYCAVLAAAAIVIAPVVLPARSAKGSDLMLAGAVLATAAALAMLGMLPAGKWIVAACLVLFFAGFSLLEMMLPVQAGKDAPVAGRGRIMGTYATLQFLGTFAGGLLGGLIVSAWGEMLLLQMAALTLTGWLAIALWQKRR